MRQRDQDVEVQPAHDTRLRRQVWNFVRKIMTALTVRNTKAPQNQSMDITAEELSSLHDVAYDVQQGDDGTLSAMDLNGTN